MVTNTLTTKQRKSGFLVQCWIVLRVQVIAHFWSSVGFFCYDGSTENLLPIKAAVGTGSLTAVLDLQRFGVQKARVISQCVACLANITFKSSYSFSIFLVFLLCTKNLLPSLLWAIRSLQSVEFLFMRTGKLIFFSSSNLMFHLLNRFLTECIIFFCNKFECNYNT